METDEKLPHEGIMVQTSVNNARTFDRIADALVLQQLRVRLKESKWRSTGKSTNSTGRGKGRKGFFRRKYKGQGEGYRHVTSIADDYYVEVPDASDQGSASAWYEDGEHYGYDDCSGDSASAYIATASDGARKEREEQEEQEEEDEEEEKKKKKK